MMKRTSCDRCQNEVDPIDAQVGVLAVLIQTEHGPRDVDLCAVCFRSFIARCADFMAAKI